MEDDWTEPLGSMLLTDSLGFMAFWSRIVVRHWGQAGRFRPERNLPGSGDAECLDSSGPLFRFDLPRIVKARVYGSVLAELDSLVFKPFPGTLLRSGRMKLPVHVTPPREFRFPRLGTYRGSNCPPALGVAIDLARNVAVRGRLSFAAGFSRLPMSRCPWCRIWG